MASRILKNVKIYLDGFDLSGHLNACAFPYAAEMQDGTTFVHDTRINRPGLRTVRAEHQGFFHANGTDGPDDVIFSRVGGASLPMTICPTDGSVGEIAYTFRTVASEYSPGGTTGELMAFGVSADGAEGEPPVRGTILQAAGSVTASGNGAAIQIGATASGQKAYCALHVLSASAGDTLDVVVQSDVDAAFASPVTVATFAQQAAVGSDWQTAAGPSTDTHFRISYTLGGLSPDFSFIVVVGIA
jgi:hypothetical protein